MDERYKELIANRLKSLRQSKGWRAEDVARRLNVTRSRYLNWECAARTPKLDMFPKIAKIFNVSASYVAGFTQQFDEQENNLKYITANQPKLDSKNLSLISDKVAFLSSVLTENGLTSENILLLTVKDNSMAPDLSKGDEVLINLSSTLVTQPDIYALRDSSNNVWLRWIRPELGGGYTLYANDKNHSNDQQLTTEQFKELDIIGRFCWSGRWRKPE